MKVPSKILSVMKKGGAVHTLPVLLKVDDPVLCIRRESSYPELRFGQIKKITPHGIFVALSKDNSVELVSVPPEEYRMLFPMRDEKATADLIGAIYSSFNTCVEELGNSRLNWMRLREEDAKDGVSKAFSKETIAPLADPIAPTVSWPYSSSSTVEKHSFVEWVPRRRGSRVKPLLWGRRFVYGEVLRIRGPRAMVKCYQCGAVTRRDCVLYWIPITLLTIVLRWEDIPSSLRAILQ